MIGDLVDCCIPGDVLTVCGIVKARKADADGPARGNKSSKSLFVLYLDANFVTKGNGDEPTDVRGTPPQRCVASLVLTARCSLLTAHRLQYRKAHMEFSQKDLLAIQSIRRREPNMFRLLVHSLCPGIFGHELVKGARPRDSHRIPSENNNSLIVWVDVG